MCWCPALGLRHDGWKQLGGFCSDPGRAEPPLGGLQPAAPWRVPSPPMPVILRWFFRLGPTHPITVRLVQNGSRRLRHLYIRSGYLAALILVLLWALLTKGG